MFRISALTCIAALVAAAMGQARSAVLGRVGQATTNTTIYAAPNSHSRVYYRVKAAEYLVVKSGPKKGWLAVLLTTGSYGYVPAKSVNELQYQVSERNAPAQEMMASRPQQQLASRSGFVRSRSGAASEALNFVGRVPYKFGGTDISSGIDCSAFVKKMYGTIGLDLPRTAAEQANVGEKIYRLEDLQSGDRLYFWDAKRGMIGHTGIYVGGGYFVHSSHGNKGVATNYLTPSWRRILVDARR